jgi:hypothetical protein
MSTGDSKGAPLVWRTAELAAAAATAAGRVVRWLRGAVEQAASQVGLLAGEEAPTPPPLDQASSKAASTNAAPAKKAPAKKAPAKKTPAKKTPAKKAPAKKTPAKKAPARKGVAKKGAAKNDAAKKGAAKNDATKKAAVKKRGGAAGRKPRKDLS